MNKNDLEYIDLTQNIVDIVKNPYMHALHFKYKGLYYCFSGWWLLEVTKTENPKDDTDEVASYFYDSKEDFLKSKVFDGKTLAEISGEVSEIDCDVE